MKKQIITAMAVVALVGASSADVLFNSAFDGNTGAHVFAGNTDNTTGAATLGITDWTTDASVTAISGLSAISGTMGGTFVSGGFAQTQNGTAAFANSNNVYLSRNHNQEPNNSEKGFSLAFTTDTLWDLSTLTVIAGHANNSGGVQVWHGDLNYSLSGGTLGAPVSGLISVDYSTAGDYNTVAFDLTGTTIGAGGYTLQVYQNSAYKEAAYTNVAGAYAMYDGITLEAIPEPATLGMVALFGGGLLFVRRKLMI